MSKISTFKKKEDNMESKHSHFKHENLESDDKETSQTRFSQCKNKDQNNSKKPNFLIRAFFPQKIQASKKDFETINEAIQVKGIFSLSGVATPTVECTIKPQGKGSDFKFNCIPDTGTTNTMMSADLVNANGLKINHKNRPKVLPVGGSRLNILGTTEILIDFKNWEVAVSAIVCADMRKEILIDWKTLIDLGILPKNFPNAICNEEERALPKIKDEKNLVKNENPVNIMAKNPKSRKKAKN